MSRDLIPSLQLARKTFLWTSPAKHFQWCCLLSTRMFVIVSINFFTIVYIECGSCLVDFSVGILILHFFFKDRIKRSYAECSEV